MISDITLKLIQLFEVIRCFSGHHSQKYWEKEVVLTFLCYCRSGNGKYSFLASYCFLHILLGFWGKKSLQLIIKTWTIWIQNQNSLWHFNCQLFNSSSQSHLVPSFIYMNKSLMTPYISGLRVGQFWDPAWNLSRWPRDADE